MNKWNKYYMELAALAATMAKHTTKVGAVLVGPEGEIRLTGYNGVPRGVEDTPERTSGESRHKWHSHAEANLIAFAAREGIRTKGCSVYVTHYPCSSCARTLIQAGVNTVYVGDGTTTMPDEEFEVAAVMFDEAGVYVERM
jgi:dCMP deaminase